MGLYMKTDSALPNRAFNANAGNTPRRFRRQLLHNDLVVTAPFAHEVRQRRNRR